jgi:hypothetical protein
VAVAFKNSEKLVKKSRGMTVERRWHDCEVVKKTLEKPWNGVGKHLNGRGKALE